MTPRERLVVALDVPDEAQATRLVDVLAGSVGMFKVGSQLFTAAGPGFVRSLAERGLAVFLDLKFHDIPNTVSRAVAATGALRVSLLTIHGLGGREMLEAAVLARPTGTRLLAITVLTSHTAESLGRIGIAHALPDQVERLALLAREAGVDGVVASPHEVEAIRGACGRDFLVVTPGIRPPNATAGDQARAATPASALLAGADYLVVGRPITEASDPRAAVQAIVREMETAAARL